jgi:hypothetical protein
MGSDGESPSHEIAGAIPVEEELAGRPYRIQNVNQQLNCTLSSGAITALQVLGDTPVGGSARSPIS